MLTSLEVAYRKLRRRLSRSEWLVSLLQLTQYGPLPAPEKVENSDTEHVGLVLIQIDGLGLSELERAIESGEAPFIARLLKREHYHCHPMYSGLPSSTPAVQGELFYGVKTIVPAFAFKPANGEKMARMYDPLTAQQVQSVLEDGHEPLLADGSAYCNIYTGGARESHFCASSFGWDEMLKHIKPGKWILVGLLNLPTLIRILFFVLLEILIAFYDFFRGQLNGRSFLPEFKFIAARVGISILMRDITTESACMDIARGLPVIQLNYIGYDEHAHRRGPDSSFAHWSIKGIDRCVEKLWNAAHRTDTRHYDLWVYSDHGQESTIPYQKKAGVSINESVSAAFNQLTTAPKSESLPLVDGVQHQRAQLLGGSYLQKIFAPAFHKNTISDAHLDSTLMPQVVAMGPVGHVYLKPDFTDYGTRQRLAKSLVSDHHVPAAVVVTPENKISVCTRSGVYDPSHSACALFGSDHPNKHALAQDLHRLCTHENAGHVVLLGWINGEQALSFPEENGAHAGLGPKETQAFALLPRDVSVDPTEFGSFRPLTLRKAVQHHLHPDSTSLKVDHNRHDVQADTGLLKVMTYNVHSCVGMDGIASVSRIARVIARYRPDVVALQELDVGKQRSHGIHQAEQLSQLLKMHCHFNPAMVAEHEQYGDAILSKYPIQPVKSCALQSIGKKGLEPRSAQWVYIEFNGSTIQLVNTHLGLNAEERRAQVDELMGNQWLNHEKFLGPAIVCGDLNATPGSYVLKSLLTKLTNVQNGFNGTKNHSKTFSSRAPLLSIDHILTNPYFEVLSVQIPNTQLTRIASDHLPLIAALKLKVG